MIIVHPEGVDLNRVKMSYDEMLHAFERLPACLIDYVVGAVLEDMREIAYEDDRLQDVEVIQHVLRIHGAPQ